MFDQSTRDSISALASRVNVNAAALLAVTEVESGGVSFATIDGRKEPLIRFEGHYFDKRLSPSDRATARAQGLSSPTAGAVKNPASQFARWKLLERASAINVNAAFESTSFGVGQVMGAHWSWLGFKSITEMVNLCRRDVVGQVEVMVRFIEKAGLAGALRAGDWKTFAKGYNGPAYAANAYDKKMAAAYVRYAGQSDRTVKLMQERLTAHGFPLTADGIRGKKTDAALRAFQKAKKLVVDGVCGSVTWAALDSNP